MPVMPGVLIIETMAQVSSVLIFSDDGEARDPGKVAIFLGIDRAKFRRTVVPGDQLEVEAEMLHLRHNACKVRAVARVDGAVACEADMMFGLMDSSTPDADTLRNPRQGSRLAAPFHPDSVPFSRPDRQCACPRKLTGCAELNTLNGLPRRWAMRVTGC